RGLVHRRMGVHGADDFFGGGFEAAGEGEFGDEFGGLVADDVGAEDFAAGEAADDLGEAVGGAGGDGLAQGGEGEGADGVVLVLDLAELFEGLFGVADAGDLGVAVGAAGDDRVVDRDRLVGHLGVLGLPGDALDAEDGFFAGDVGEPGG